MRRELARLVVRGVTLVAVIAALAVLPVVVSLDVPTRDEIAAAAVILLLAYALGVNALRLARGRATPDARLEAWDRAREVDPADAMLGRMVAVWVPIGLLAASSLLVGRTAPIRTRRSRAPGSSSGCRRSWSPGCSRAPPGSTRVATISPEPRASHGRGSAATGQTRAADDGSRLTMAGH